MNINGRDPEQCTSYRWCEETGEHSTHTKYLISFGVMDLDSGPAALSLVDTGTTKGDRHVEIVLNGADLTARVVLSRLQQEQMARALNGKPKR